MHGSVHLFVYLRKIIIGRRIKSHSQQYTGLYVGTRPNGRNLKKKKKGLTLTLDMFFRQVSFPGSSFRKHFGRFIVVSKTLCVTQHVDVPQRVRNCEKNTGSGSKRYNCLRLNPFRAYYCTFKELESTVVLIMNFCSFQYLYRHRKTRF